MAVPIRLSETSVDVGKPLALFDLPPRRGFQVSRDGQRFLVAVPVNIASDSQAQLTVDANWRVGLAK